MEKLVVIKIGGNVIDDEGALHVFLANFAMIKEKKILVHGGGKMATRVAEAMGIKQELIDGRRITDAETIKIVTMVYAGYINKNIVSILQSYHCNAIGLSGADGNAIQAHKREHTSVDYGFAGDIDQVNTGLIQQLLEQDLNPVFCSVTHDIKGTLLNTNADTIAQEIASSMSSLYDTTLIYCFEKKGVLMDATDDRTVIQRITASDYADLKKNNVITAGMIPKLDNAFAALNFAVKYVTVGHASDLQLLIAQQSGTTLVNE